MLTVSLAEYDMNLVKIWELADTKDVAGAWKQAQVSFKTLDAYKIFIDVTSSGDAKTFIGQFETSAILYLFLKSPNHLNLF